MTIITSTFSKLRLSKYLSPDEFEKVSSFEFLGEVWVGEIAGFTQILQLASEPEITKSIQIDLENGQRLGGLILSDLGLPYRFGVSRSEIEKNMKIKPFRTNSYIDRIEDEYALENKEVNLYVSFLISREKGLSYMSIIVDKK